MTRDLNGTFVLHAIKNNVRDLSFIAVNENIGILIVDHCPSLARVATQSTKKKE
jgi:hypothetical protein